MVLPSWNDEHSPKAYYPSTYFGMSYAFLGDAPKPKFELSVHDHITLGRVPGVYTFAIHTNEAWSVSVEGGEGWLLGLSPLQGWGTQQITFSVAENVAKTRRTAIVTVRCGNGSESFPVNQDGKTE